MKLVIPISLIYFGLGCGFPINVDGETVGAIGLSGEPTVQNDVDCARAALALIFDVVQAGSFVRPDDWEVAGGLSPSRNTVSGR